MTNPGIFGKSPFSVALIHGGPGSPGSMTPVSKELSKFCGIIEPLQTTKSIEEQIQELNTILNKYADSPITLIGHSWGAWLSYIYSSRYTSMVKKLILISSPPFEEKYVAGISKVRLARLNQQEKDELETLQKKLNNQEIADKKSVFKRFGEIMSKADSYESITSDNDETDYQPELFFRVWNEAIKLRQTGELLKTGQHVKCPVIAIHGDYDPHPANGVRIPLSKTIKNFRFILLEKCGHTPWLEKNRKEKFYQILREEIGLA